MTHSEEIHEIAAALAKAQGAITGAVKDSANPFFKSKYADLASVWDACRKPLSDNGLSVIQSPEADGVRVTVETLLLHSSGQWFRNSLSVSAKEDSPQAIGSAITYLRRYVLQSFAGVAPEDDDGEAAQGHKNGQTARPVAVPTAPKAFDEWLADICAVAQEGTDSLQSAWKASKPEYRQHLTSTSPQKWESLKAIAAKVSVSA